MAGLWEIMWGFPPFWMCDANSHSDTLLGPHPARCVGREWNYSAIQSTHPAQSFTVSVTQSLLDNSGDPMAQHSALCPLPLWGVAASVGQVVAYARQLCPGGVL